MISRDGLKRNVFPGESGGDYDALFDYANRPGKQFQNVRLTDMTVDEALAFANPRGEYAQSVKGQIGRVATPMGAYQVVGSTLRDAKRALGLTGGERMTPDLQDRIGMWIYETQGPGAWEAWGKGGGTSAPDRNALAVMAQPEPLQDPRQNALAMLAIAQQFAPRFNQLDPAAFMTRNRYAT